MTHALSPSVSPSASPSASPTCPLRIVAGVPAAPGAPARPSRTTGPVRPVSEGRPTPGTSVPARIAGSGEHARTGILARRRPCTADSEPAHEEAYLPLSRTTDRVLAILLEGDLYRLRADSVAEALGISSTTLRRRLRNDHTNYQFLLDRARQYRCEARLRERWLPGKCMADELGYLEVNSFYRAFRRWTGMSYSDYKLREFT